MKRIIIAGGSDVGISAALRVRELDSSIRPLIITDNSFPNFSICGIPFYIGGEVKHWKDLAHRTADDINDAGIDIMINTKVNSIDPRNKKITAVSFDNKQHELEYDKLVLGIGGVNIVPPVKGIGLPGVFFMRWMDDCLNFDKYLKEQKPAKAVIVGGGYVGLEMAEALIRRGLRVTLVEFADTVLTTVDRPFRKIIQERLEEKGIEIVTGVGIEEIEASGGRLNVYGTGGFKAETDTVLISVGTKPNTALGAEAGIETGLKGAFRVNRKLETSIPDIYSGGDCVETLNQITGRHTYYALGSVAHKHGRVIGSNICGRDIEFAGAIGTQSIKLFDTVVARTGLDEKEAAENGFTPVTAEIETWDHKVYYPPAYKTFVRVIADENTKQILGAQILGSINSEISKRIDIFAAAVYHKMNLSDFCQLDLSYTPPLSSPWDPVQMAVHKIDL